MNRVGGRFNFGQIEANIYRPFAALYVASDRATAMQEMLADVEITNGLSLVELALQRKDSISIVSMSGRVELALDITKDACLEPFLDEIRSFNVPRELVRWSKRLGLNPPGVVDSMEKLRRELEFEGWRGFPAALAVPSNSQNFGELAMAAGIEAIIYRSVKTEKLCLAAFPGNLAKSDSFVQLDDDPPLVTPPAITRLDRNSWQDLV